MYAVQHIGLLTQAEHTPPERNRTLQIPHGLSSEAVFCDFLHSAVIKCPQEFTGVTHCYRTLCPTP